MGNGSAKKLTVSDVGIRLSCFVDLHQLSFTEVGYEVFIVCRQDEMQGRYASQFVLVGFFQSELVQQVACKEFCSRVGSPCSSKPPDGVGTIVARFA